MNSLDTSRLTKAAMQVRQYAYAPYSRFLVGAALLTKSGKIFTGCNVENASLGLTTCAEQGAVSAAVAAGEKEFVAIAVVADASESVLPCGRCRQVLAEFNAEMEIVASTVDGEHGTFVLSHLLPKGTQGILESLKNVRAAD
jgi:cytidine deaminase